MRARSRGMATSPSLSSPGIVLSCCACPRGSQVGQAHFPDDPQMVLAYANFIISIKKGHQVGARCRGPLVLCDNWQCGWACSREPSP